MNYSHLKGGMKILLDQEATISEVPDDATADTDRTMLATGIACTNPIELNKDEKDRAGMGNIYSLVEMIIDPPSVSFKENDRIIVNSVDYKIRKLQKFPVVGVELVYVLAEDES